MLRTAIKTPFHASLKRRLQQGLFTIWMLLLIAPAVAVAQLQNTGTVLGNITDAGGGAVLGATVVLTSSEKGQSLTQKSNGKGEYLFSSVAVGTYTVKITAPGFGTVTANKVTVDADSNVRFDRKLTPASVETSVTVDADADHVDTQSATIGLLLDPNLIHNLPIDGNNVVELAALLPGVSNVNAPTTFTSDTGGPSYNVSGARSTQNLFLLDGALWNNLYTNSALNFPGPDSLQEVTVLLNNFKAQYGRNVGSVFSAITKSGSNRVHGVVFEYLQNTALNAFDYFNQVGTRKPEYVSNQFGGTVGGPIKRDKLFFFASYQGTRIARLATNPNASIGFTPADRGEDATGAQDVPCSSNGYFAGNNCVNLSDQYGSSTQVTLNGRLSYLHNPLSPANTATSPAAAALVLNTAYTQAGGTLAANANSPCVSLLQAALLQNGTYIANNELPDQCVNPVALAIINKYIPVPNNGVLTATSAKLPQSDDAGLLRVDYNLGHGHNLDARFYQTAVSDLAVRGAVQTYEPDAEQGSIHFGNLGDTWVLKPNLLNLLRVAYKRYNYFYTPLDHATLASFGANFASYNSVPVLPVFPNLGAASQAVSSTVNEDIEVSDTLSLSRGRHNYQFGFDYLRLQYENIAEFAPSFSFGESFTESFAGDELLGLVSNEVVANSLNRSGIQHDYYFFVQDDWRITPRTTVNLGLRYELPLRYYQPKGQDTTFINGYQSIVFPNAVPDLAFVGDPGIPRALIKNEYTDFAPRFGIAYDLSGNGRTSLRAGFGIFYDATNALTIGVGEPYHFSANYAYPAGGLSNPLLGLNAVPANYNGHNAQFTTPFSIFYPDRNFRGSYTEAANVGFQQAIGRKSTLEVNYVLRLGRHQALPLDQNPAIYDCSGAYYQINPTLYCPQGPQATTQQSYQARVRYPGFNYGGQGVVDYMSIGTSNYNGLQVLYRQQASRGISVTATFSYAKSMDEFSNGATAANTTPQINNLASQYGPSDYDVKLTTGVGWTFAPTKFNRGPRTLQALLSGWTQSGLYTASTGQPFSVTLTTDTALTGEVGSYQRAQLSPGAVGTLPGNRHRADKIKAWFPNTPRPSVSCLEPSSGSAWTWPACGTFSNQSRNDLRGPGFILLNLSAGRVFPIHLTDTTRLAFRADAINAFNTPNLAQPNHSFPSTSGADTEGTITSTVGSNSNTLGNNGRRIQLSLKFIY